MLTPRNVILASATILLAVLVWSVLSLLRAPDSEGLAADSYGTQQRGQRALFETLSELELPVARRVEPPGKRERPESRLVLWGPHPRMVAAEPRHLQRLVEWVESGGRVLVAPSPPETGRSLVLEQDLSQLSTFQTTLWEALGLDEVSLEAVGPGLLDPDADAAADHAAGHPRGRLPGDSFVYEHLRKLSADIAQIEAPIEASGALTEAARDVRTLSVPLDDLYALVAMGRKPHGEIRFRDRQGKLHTLVAAFPVGEGQIVVVSDPMLFNNALLGQADNAVLAANLLVGDGRTAVFDEFYHGLSVRGNPFWLLTRPGSALLAVLLVLLVGVTTWRSAILLGPPPATIEPSRRTVSEYVDAMSRFFNRGRRMRQPLLEAVYTGALRQLAAEHGLAHHKVELEAVATAVARRNPARARRLREAGVAVDAVLTKGHNVSEQETLRAMEQTAACL